LVADDNPDMLNVITSILNNEGYDAHGVEGGLKALESLEQTDYQVAIIDQGMPNLNGIEVLKRIIEKYPQTKVIIISAFPTIEYAVEAIKYGASDFIEKPFLPDRLFSTIRLATEHSETQEKQKAGSCPKCGRKMQKSWRYCPYDGALLI